MNKNMTNPDINKRKMELIHNFLKLSPTEQQQVIDKIRSMNKD